MPKQLKHGLNALAIKQLNKPGWHADGNNLYLQIRQPNGGKLSKSWVFRYKRAGRQRVMGLGSLEKGIGLADAREAAKNWQKVLALGLDPITERNSRKAESAMTFRATAEEYIEERRHRWKPGSTSEKSWSGKLGKYAYPKIGNLPVSAITLKDVERVLKPIWVDKYKTAQATRGYIEAVLDFATARGMRTGDNPAKANGPLGKMPWYDIAYQTKNKPAIPYFELPDFMDKLRVEQHSRDYVGLCLEFTILTALRPAPVRQARWDQIVKDEETGQVVWQIPAHVMKGRRQEGHRVPLSDRAIELLESIEKRGDYIFWGSGKDGYVSINSMDSRMKRMGRTETPHGTARSSFTDWATETTNFPQELIKAATAHSQRSRTERAYQRGDLLGKRGALMQAWSDYLTCRQHVSNVVAISGATT